jgi:poly(hydroxyalkanoate) granule-associated protein
MSEDQNRPTISVTRGKRSDRRKKSSRKTSSGSVVPGPMDVATGLVRGAQSLWWAGLGALSVAEEAGTKVFDALVEEGKSWEQARREQRQATVERVEAFTKESTRTMDAVEERVRDEVHAALRQLGVPRRRDVDALRTQIDALSEKLDRLAEAIDDDREDA